MKKIAFVCIHNSCRSQIAEALCRAEAGDVFDVYSAGTYPAPEINPSAVRLMKTFYGIDMTDQHPKSLSALPEMDIIVTMGCGVSCPHLPCSRKISWNIEDPSGKPDEEYLAIIRAIRDHIRTIPGVVV